MAQAPVQQARVAGLEPANEPAFLLSLPNLPELRQQVMGMLTRVTATSQARIDDDDERVSA